jgi:hypothetical protein
MIQSGLLSTVRNSNTITDGKINKNICFLTLNDTYFGHK